MVMVSRLVVVVPICFVAVPIWFRRVVDELFRRVVDERCLGVKNMSWVPVLLAKATVG